MNKTAAVVWAPLFCVLLCSAAESQIPTATTVKTMPTAPTGVSALVANFPVPAGAMRRSFTSNRHSGGSWQELALYALRGAADGVANDYAQQIMRAGWSVSSISASGTPAAGSYRAVQDYALGPSKAHVVVAQDPNIGVAVTTTITTNFAAGATPSLSLDVTATPPTGATSSTSDQGTADPADFPRLPGSIRSSYQASVSSGTKREDARYAASGGVSNAEAFFATQLPQTQWNESYRFIEIDDVHQATKVQNTWQTSYGSASLTLSSMGTGGTTLLVTVTRNTAAALPGTAAGGVIAPASPPTNAPPPVTSSLMPPSPVITGLTVLSSSPVAHVVQWDCVKDEWLCGNSGKIAAAGSTPSIPIFEYAISSKAPGASQFEPVNPTSAIAAFGDCLNPPTCTQAALHVKANLGVYIAPNTTLRVVRTDKQGKLAAANGDFAYASPPQPQEPSSFSATEPQFGEVKLTWTPVAGPTRYLISEKGVNAPPAQVPNQSTTYQGSTLFKNVSPGSHTYRIASDYGVAVPAVNIPEASVLVHRVPPPRGVPFLTKNNGAGSDADATKHLKAYVDSVSCVPINNDPDNYGCVSGGNGFNMSGPFNAAFLNRGTAALYANVTELALGRSVKCWENNRDNRVLVTDRPSYTLSSIDCLAANHGALVGAATPNALELAATAASGTSFAAVWMHFDVATRDMTFVNFIPSNGASELPDPNTTGQTDGWKTAKAATLDSEGAKYLPHVCLPCHGGTYHPDTGKVTGATFLPIDPSLVAFSNQPGHDRAGEEESIRQLNSIIMASKPAQPVADYINGMYPGGTLKLGPVELAPVDQAGKTAQANYVPTGWAQQADFFKSVVKPNCLMCHLATSSPSLVFDSADKFFANKALLYAAVCAGRSMPNAELPYNNLWSSIGPSGTVHDGPAATLSAALGHNSCP